VRTLVKSNVSQKLNKILAHYSGRREELIPILQEAQDNFNHLPLEAMEGIAKFLRLAPSAVFGVSTFYSQFKLTPQGKRIVNICRGTACYVRGAAQILDETEKKLGIKPGETTEDLEYTLETVACIGACALAPTITVNKEVHGQMTTEKVRNLFDDSGK